MRVLVFEPDPRSRLLVAQELESRGHEVITLQDPDETWSLLQQELFPLVVVDWSLERRCEQGFFRRIRGLPHGEQTVFLVLTERAHAEDLLSVIGAGVNDYLPKPFDRASLAARITLAERQVSGLEDRRRYEESLPSQLLHDPVTDLPGWALFDDRLSQALLLAERSSECIAVLLLDVDWFSGVSGTDGYPFSDLVLQEVGRRLVAGVRGSDTVARVGGDQFAMLLHGADLRGAQIVAERTLRALHEPLRVDTQVLDLSAHAGLSVSPEHGQHAEVLVRRADAALGAARLRQQPYLVYSFDLEEQSPGRLALVSELRRAVQESQLVLHFQPTLRCGSGKVSGVEALVRWQHPSRGMIPPAHFIPLAEQTGVIDPLSFWVLSASLRQCRAWREAQVELPVAVNLSMRNLHNLQLPSVIAEMLRETAVPPQLLRIEITESAIMANPARAMRVVSQLHAMGVRLDIDDFGTGYSSLAYLKRLPVDQIKIDRTFVRDMLRVGSDLAIVRSTIELGHNLGLEVLAEGVEDQATLEALIGMGCDAAQGFHLGKPLPATELLSWLERSPWELEGDWPSQTGGAVYRPSA